MKFLQDFFLGVIILLLLTPVHQIFAHALPLQSNPSTNAILDSSPAQIEIFFSEPLEASFSSIQVFNSQGEQIDNDDSRLNLADAKHLTVTMRSSPDGVYTVVWRVLSTVDGHVTAGSFPFAVGNVDPLELEAAGQASQTYTISPYDIVARWLTFLTSASFMGGSIFLLFVWSGAKVPQSIQERMKPVWQRIIKLSLSAIIVGSILGVMAQAGLTKGAELSAPWDKSFANVLLTTRGGVFFLSRIVAALTIFILLQKLSRKSNQWLALGLSLLILLTISLTSHSAALRSPIIPIIGDWVHLSAAAIWIGGLIYFVVLMWIIRADTSVERTQFIARLIPRFSILAISSVVALGLTGLYSAFINVGTIERFLTTLYGQMLLGKSALLLPMLGLGAFNLLLVTGRMKRAAVDETQDGNIVIKRFRTSISTEIVLGISVMLVVAILTTVPPANLTTEGPALKAQDKADDLNIALEVSPGRIGINTFTAMIRQNDKPLTDALEVNLRFTPTTVDIPPNDVTLNNIGEGQYQVEGSYFSLPDSWQVQVSVRRQNAFDAFANLNFSVGVQPQQNIGFSWDNVAGFLLILLAVAYLFVRKALIESDRWSIIFGVLCTTILFIAGLIVIARPDATLETAVVNPIAPNADSIATGEELYTRNCVPCHGLTGKGDGPVGLTLNPPPADLIIHTIPGVHPDGQLYLWISDGFAGASAMPAFRTILTDDERWHLVNYIRTFAQRDKT